MYRNPVHNVVTETTYTNLRQNLASLLDRVADDHELVIVRRKGDKRVALVPAEELAGLMETAHLLRSPRNATRLLSALRRAQARKGKAEPLEKLRREMGIAPQRRSGGGIPSRKYPARSLYRIGKPEPLKYLLAGCWSRRLAQEHRLVYRVSTARVDFLQARYHY